MSSRLQYATAQQGGVGLETAAANVGDIITAAETTTKIAVVVEKGERIKLDHALVHDSKRLFLSMSSLLIPVMTYLSILITVIGLVPNEQILADQKSRIDPYHFCADCWLTSEQSAMPHTGKKSNN
ncbi:MAG: hypothetical protein AUH84_07905 [Thaumarchaeota archaeon 13_1_40CM_4_38_7]|nr:MAG: hypothetical protein AUH84_07905 [Thaumarchaeota archaeon 13_1_40CM_4_38_7]